MNAFAVLSVAAQSSPHPSLSRHKSRRDKPLVIRTCTLQRQMEKEGVSRKNATVMCESKLPFTSPSNDRLAHKGFCLN